MNNIALAEKIKSSYEGQVRILEPMSKHTTFRVGGAADAFIEVGSVQNLEFIMDFVLENNLPYFILGKGSNLLVSDRGYKGFIIHLDKEFDNISVKGTKVKAGAGASLKKTARLSAQAFLTGMEGLEGIPGTIGGAIFMNAGAYGYEIEAITDSVKAFSPSKGIYELYREELEFGYRHSIFRDNKDIILEATFSLKAGDSTVIESNINDFTSRRKKSQPLELPSAGSTFKRPEGYFTGKLIEEAGLRGYRIGGASVSTKHCGFVVNDKNAKAVDVYKLIRHIQNVIKEKNNVELQTEVIMLGDFK